MLPSYADSIRVDRAMVRRHGLIEFARRAWPVIYPAKTYRERWYHRALCTELDMLRSKSVRSLVVTMPPGTAKSLYCSVMFPALRLIDLPHEGIACATYDGKLGGNWSRQIRQIITSRWFIDRWGAQVRADVDANGRRVVAGVTEWFTNKGGFLYSTTIPRGPITGRHPGLRKVDDSIKPINATPENLETINEWHGGTWSTRGEDQNTVQELIVGQRLASNDLPDVVAQQGARLFSLPAEFDPKNANPADIRTEEKQVLDDERLSPEVLRVKKIQLGGDYSAQYNQSPGVGSRTFDRAHFKFYDQLPASFDTGAISLDCAFRDTATSDRVAGQAWGVKGPDFFLLEAFAKRLDFVGTLQALVDLSRRHAWIYSKLVEAKANGDAVIRVMKNKFPGIEPVEPLGSKLARANSIAPVIRSGNVWLPRGAEWLPDWLDEVSKFPGSTNDDSVDAMSQCLAHLLDLGFGAESALYVDLDLLRGLYR